MSRAPHSTDGWTTARIGRGDSNWLRLVPDAIEEAGPFAFVFDTEPPLYVRKLMDTLGVDVIVDRANGRMEVVRL